MSDTIHDIAAYFEGGLSPEERYAFERRCVSDEVFAQEVAFYVQARTLLRAELEEGKRQRFAALPVLRARVTGLRRRLLPLVAAAVLVGLVVLAGWWWWRPVSPQEQAADYISGHLVQLSVQMGGREDSLRSGIIAYNEGDYIRAAARFRAASVAGPDARVLGYLGQAYLLSGQYDAAIDVFDQLIALPQYANPGPFYKALALLRRNRSGDLQQAKRLLEQVRDQQLPGNKEAVRWLKNI